VNTAILTHNFAAKKIGHSDCEHDNCENFMMLRTKALSDRIIRRLFGKIGQAHLSYHPPAAETARYIFGCKISPCTFEFECHQHKFTYANRLQDLGVFEIGH